MSDIFFNTSDQFKPTENNNVAEQSRNYWDQENAKIQKQNQEYLQDLQKYSVYLPQEQYEVINNAIANADIPEDEAYRWASAIELNKQYGMSIQDAYQNLEQINAAIWGEKYQFTPKSNFKAIVDSGKLGANTLKLGNLGLQIMAAEQSGNTEQLNSLLDEYDAINAENETLYDYMDRNIAIEALKFGAQSAPFTGYVAGVGILGSLIAPGVGTAAAFTASMSNAAGLQYMQLREAGSDKGAALGLSLISGGLQAVVETSLGTAAGALGKAALGGAAKEAAVQKITANLFKRLNFNGTMKSLAGKLGKEYLKENFEEGMEEVIQGLIESGTNALAAELGNYDIDGNTAQDIAKEAWENFRGGILGSLVLGLPASAIHVKATTKEFTKVRDAAATIGSEEMFDKAVDKSPIFEGMDEAEKKEAKHTIFENVQSDMEAAELHEARAQAEVNTADETFENIEADEESGETNAAPVVRDDLTGGLIVQDDITEDNGDIKKGSYRAGDNTKSEKNNYGYINYTIDENNKTVIIDKFSMNAVREGLREELYDNFARDYAGYSIEWDPKLKIAKDVKERLVEANPSGKNNGLNYYNSKDEIANIQTRKEVAGQIREAYKAAGKNLTNEQVAADVAILESLYNRLGRDMKDRGVNSFSDYVSYTFGNRIFGNQQEAFNAAARQGEQGKVQGASVTRDLKDFDRGMKALIYVTKNGDFSTFSHEVAHIARKQMTGALLDEAAQAFNVQKDADGNYDWTNQNEEDFAYGFEQFLRTGKAKNDALKTVFEKIAQFLNDCMTALKSQIRMTPEIENVYNELLAGDKSVLAAAKRAAEQSDAEYRQQQEEETVRAAEDKYKLEQEEREANAETTDYDGELEAPTVTQNDTVNTEGTAPASQEEVINSALDNTNLSEAQKEEAASVLNDPEETIGAKEEVIQDVAGEALREETPDALFQIIGELGATNLDRVEEVTTRMDNKKVAEEMEKAGKDAKAIRFATGWERGKEGKWRYETNDLLNKFDLVDKLANFKKLNPRYVELSNKLENILNGGEGLNSDEIAEMDKLADEANVYIEKQQVKLKDILDAPELYTAYPQLKNMDVEFTGNYDSNTKAAYSIEEDLFTGARRDLIEINNTITDFNKKEYEGILLHEIQHAIQLIEGFAVGGSTEQFENDTESRKLADIVRSMNFETDNNILGRNGIQLSEKGINKALDKEIAPGLTVRNAYRAKLNRIAQNNNYQDIETLVKEVFGNIKTPYEKYLSLAGEVEARNVQSRLNMSDVERLNTLLEATEDVARKDQLVMKGALQMASADINALSKVNEKDFMAVSGGNNEYIQLSHDPLNAALFLIKHQQGMVRNVFDSKDNIAGKIGLTYGHEKEGLFHLLQDHINSMDFPSLEEALKVIEDVLANGTYTEVDGKYNVDKDGYRVVITKDNKNNFVITAFNSTKARSKKEKLRGNTTLLRQSVSYSQNGTPVSGSLNNSNNNTIDNNVNNDTENDNPVLSFQTVTDPAEIERLEKEPTVKAYRAMQLIDGKLYPPMSAKVDGKLREPIELGAWEKADENPDMADDNGMFKLNKGNGKTILARYNPYFHSSPTMLNDQFSEAQDRPNLVTVEVEIPASELNNDNPYRAEKAKDTVGTKQWKAGIIQAQLTGTREVNLSRWDKPMRIVPAAEVAQNIKNTFGDKNIVMPSNVVPPEVRAKLEKLGVKFVNTTNKGVLTDGENAGIHYSKVYGSKKNNLLFQTAYHGTAADFDKFDTERYGLSGEGSMAFGYGTYLSGSEAIARDYAERQGMHAYDKMSDNYYGQDVAHLLDFTRQGMSFEEAKQKVIEDHNKNIAKYELVYGKGHSSVANSYYDKINFVNSLTEEDLHNRKLLTVEIPDNGFLQWDKNTDYSIVEAARDRLYNYLIENDEDGSYEGNAKDYLKKELEYTFNAQMTGQNLYQTLTSYLNSERTTSKFLNEMGVAGMEYPAGTNFGTPDGEEARNYVIYNDDDAQIVEKLAFQTQQELYNDARSFATWQEFMDHYQNDFDPAALEDPTYHNQVPSDASAQWYQTTWELANGIQPEESLNEQEVKDKYAKEGTEPRAMDSLFISEMTGDNGKFEDFMHMVAYYENIDLNAPEWTQVADEAEAAERDRIEQLKDLIEVTMKSESMQRAINRIAAGGEITPGFKTRLISEMSDSFKSRDFRALYAEVMDDPTYRVNPEDTTATLLENKLNDVNRRFNLQIPAVDVSRMSPQQRKELSDKLDNEEIAAKLKDGSLKMDDQVDKYIKSLTSQINELKQQQNELKKSILEETSRLADEEQKDLIKVNEELIKAKAAYDKKNDEITRKIAKGIKISSKYQKEAQNLKHDYNEILRKYKDLLATTKITGEVQRALDTQQRLGDALNNIDKLEQERTTMADVQKLRKNLVKRTMRRVKFDTVDYENARKIIAIQRIFEPNLLGGVNKWIGQRDPYLRGVISAVITDKDYRNELSNYIRDRATSSNAYSEFWAKWQDLITSPTAEEALKKFNSWDEKTRKRAIMYLPKEDWIKELQLKELEKEREESIDLDIGIKERREPMRNEKGELIYKPQYDENGKLIKNPDRQEAYYKTIYEFDASEEIKAMIRDAVGEDIYNNLLYRPFSEWTVEEMETLAKRVDDLYTEGRDILAARKQLQAERAAAIRQKIEKAVKDTGIVINDDDTPEEKAKKQAKIDKILGLNSELKGTNASKNTGFKSRMNRLLHGYVDANILRVARILDGNTEGVNVQELYRKEDDCYNNKTRSINGRVNKINKVMQENNITMDELSQQVKVGDKTFTVDELLFFAAANEDYVEDPEKMAKGLMGIDANDDYAATSRNAVMFGNLFSDTASTEFKEECAREDEEMQRRIDADELTAAERNAQILGELVTRPGTARYIQRCHEVFVDIIAAANQLDDKYKALLKVIADDYAAQYDRMNEISIKEFNTPVHRVKCYVPLVRLESNGDTNVNQVKEDLLAALGQGASKEWVNKGMTKRRTNVNPLHQKPVQTGLYKTWADSVDRTEHFISYSGYVRELNRVYKSRDAQYTRQFIENRYGKRMVTYIDDYINEVANPNANKIREKGAELLHTLRGKTAPAYLAWKASAIIKQGLTSPWPYMQFINPAEYVAASWKCITSRGAMYDAIREKSVFMNNRVMDPMNDLIDEMAEKANQNKFDKALNKFNKKGMAGLEWIDWVCVAPGWYACYNKKYNELVGKNQDVYEATKERLQEENYYAEVGTTAWKTPEQIEKLAQKAMEDDVETKAVQYADDCTRACQPSNRAADISPLFKNSSEAMKAYLQFQTSLNVIWQNLRYDIPYAIKKNEFNRVAMTIVGYALAGIFMNSVMDGIGGDDDDDGSAADDRLKNLVYYATTQFTDSVPMIGSELTNTMDKLITGKQQFMNTGTDMTPTATKFFSILTNAKKGNWEKAAEMTAEGIAMYLGLPVSGAKEIKKLAGVGDGDGEAGLNLGNVYGILDPEDYK